MTTYSPGPDAGRPASDYKETPVHVPTGKKRIRLKTSGKRSASHATKRKTGQKVGFVGRTGDVMSTKRKITKRAAPQSVDDLQTVLIRQRVAGGGLFTHTYRSRITTPRKLKDLKLRNVF